MSPATSILVYVNGARRQIDGELPLQTLLVFLRRTERLTGTKLGCGEGGCGACTVLLSTFNGRTRRIVHRAVNACLLPLASCDGAAVTTIEAVGNGRGALAPVQQALVNMHGSQCGFCTPGIVMSMFALLRDNAANRPESGALSNLDVESNFDGNLCRCTGYRPILDAFKGLVAHENYNGRSACLLGDECCKVTRISSHDSNEISNCSSSADEGESDKECYKSRDKEYIFPPELVYYEPGELNIADGKWLRPVTLQRFIELKQQFPFSRIIVGNTELGIEAKFKGLKVSTFLCASHVPELQAINEGDEGVEIGASVSWTDLDAFINNAARRRTCDEKSGESTLYKLGSLRAVQSQLRLFAGKQIRNVAAVGGNIVTASPISDVNPVWIAACSVFVVLDCVSGRERQVPARDFFVSYRKVDMSANEILLKVFVPWNKSAFDVTKAFKVSRRREDDIAIVSAGIRIRVEAEQTKRTCTKSVVPECKYHQFCIAEVVIAYGGLAPTTITYPEVEKSLLGKVFNEASLQQALEVLGRAATLRQDVPGGMPEYRQSLAVAFLFKAFVNCAKIFDDASHAQGVCAETLVGYNTELDSNLDFVPHHACVSKGSQILSDIEAESHSDQTGKSIKLLSSELQVSGEAKYLDDIPPVEGELQAALILSSEAHARIVSVQDSEAKSMRGVHRVVTFKDVAGSNLFGPRTADELCFTEDLVTSVGQVIGIVVADTVDHAKDAASAVVITYDKLPAILTIEEAIEAKSFARGEPVHCINKGNSAEVIKDASACGRVVQNTVRIGAQEHWYLEPHGTIAIPEENDEMTIFASTQAPSKTQEIVAKVLGQPMHKITCKVKRLGGGFGGKESRSLFISAAAAVAAQTSCRPVRLILDRDTDMLISGTRHAFLAKYRAAYEASGRITALELRLFLNMGNTTDLSIPVLDRALFHAQNCYDIPHVDLRGRACYTHTTSSTAFRGFGGPQGMLIAEDLVEHVAIVSKQSLKAVRDLNLYGKHGNTATTPYGMEFSAQPLISCWETVLEDAAYEKRRHDITVFNAKHRLRKRGIAAIPTMFGISFTFKTYNQAGALVHIFYGDGSVLISHGGVEMGQGLHTKICQVAATELKIPLEKVFVSETATDKVPNASPTAASSSSDMYGMAVKNACAKLNENLKASKAALGEQASWDSVVSHAWFNRVPLSATGFYKTPQLDALDLGQPDAQGRPFFYFTNGAAVSEVEIDVLTGESLLLRTDIAMDVGRPLNPAIDVGQIEGAFVQGLGWCTMEEVVRGSSTAHRWVKEGHTFTLGPSTYKIPGFTDIPKDFRVRVLETRNEKDTIHSSKAIGEPPLFLAASAFFAIRDAIRAARLQNNDERWFRLDSPATVERIRLACADGHGIKAMPSLEGVTAQLSL